MNYLFYLLAILAGLLLPVQIALNNKLTHYSGNPVTSSFVSFTVGMMVLFLYNIIHLSSFQKSLNQIGQAPTYAWFGGLIGAFYIISTIVSSPKIGLALFLALVIGGQLCMSLLAEQYGMFGMPIKPFNWVRGIGMVLVIIGVLLVRK